MRVPLERKALIAGTLILLMLIPINIIYYYGSFNPIIHSGIKKHLVYIDKNILVTWKPGGSPKLKITVTDKNGKPIEFSALITIPTLKGFEEIDRIKGKGSITADLSNHISKLSRLLNSLGWKPHEAQFSILTIITTAKISNETIDLETMFTTIPLPPAFTNGTVEAHLIFNPIFKYKVNITNETQGTQQFKAETQWTPSQPPSTFGDYCDYVDPVSGAYSCYSWKLNETLYVGDNVIPSQITIVSDVDANNIGMIQHLSIIQLDRTISRKLSFDMSIGIPSSGGSLAEIQVPGPGFTLTLGDNEESRLLYKLICSFYNKVATDHSECTYVKDTYDFILQPFTGNMVVASGFRGKIYVVKYVFVHEEFPGIETVLNESIAIWFAPYAKSVDGVNYIDYYVELDPIDDMGELEEIIRLLTSNYKEKVLPTEFEITHIVSGDTAIQVSAGSTREFGIGIPAGLIALVAGGLWELAPILLLLNVGINLHTDYIEAYSLVVQQMYQGLYYKSVNYTSSYYEVPKPYLITNTDSYIKVPLLVIRPGAGALEVTYAGGAGSGNWSLSASNEGGNVKLYAESLGEGSGPIPYQMILDTLSTGTSESSAVVEYVIKPNWPISKYYYLYKINYTINAFYDEYAKFVVEARIIDPEGFIVDEAYSEHPLYSGAGEVLINGTLYLRLDNDYRGKELLLIIEFKAVAWYNEDLYALADAYSVNYGINYTLRVDVINRYAGTKPY
ncbi:MAG: hypothetical protein F7C81_01455 [Desulfurococcales archaeon]|nr:hypothetical protein [Desulfurococcales archaeon]